MKTKKEIINELENLKKYTAEAIKDIGSALLITKVQVYHQKFVIDKIIKTHPEIISSEDNAEAEEEARLHWEKQLEEWKIQTQ